MLDDVSDFFLGKLQQYVLWFEVCMDDPANPMQKIQPDQCLLGDAFAQVQRNLRLLIDAYPLEIVSFDDLQQVHSQDLEHHAKMGSVGSLVHERVE
jgi:hypothetical protein